MRVENFLTESAIRHRDKTALIAGEKRMSFGELDAASSRLASVLLRNGVRRGDRVVLYLENSWEAAVGIFAVLKIGAVFVCVNSSMKAAKLANVLSDCRPTTLMTQERLVAVANDALVEVPSVKLAVVAGHSKLSTPCCITLEDALAEPLVSSLPDAGIELDLAMLVYTSGSTGNPKGVMMTHGNVIAAATSVTTYLENTADDVIINVLPISFSYGLYQILMAAKLGATLVLEKSFAFPQAIVDRMKAHGVTGLPLVPTMAATILQMKSLKGSDFPHLRYITNAAAALPPAHIEGLQGLFPRAKLYSMYGMTECKRATYLPPSELRTRPASVGIAIPGTEAYIVDEGGKRVPAGETGELVIRGPHVMKGYWNNPKATAITLRDGPYPWEKVLYTGDLFRTDAEGFLYYVSRKDDIIKSRGEKVSPKEVENVLYGLPGIVEAVVVGVPDPILGSAIKAVVVLAPGAHLSERDIVRHCAKHLEDFMAPKTVEFRDALPKTDSGKISRRKVEADILEAAE